jgi:hypothetical protein
MSLAKDEVQLRSSDRPLWDPFLRAFAIELDSRLDSQSIRTLMHRLGVLMAQTAPLPAVELLPDLQLHMNQVWSGWSWGHVVLRDAGSALEIIHSGAPLQAAFGHGSHVWCPALLAGVYETWLHGAGASESIRVHTLDSDASASDADASVFIFSFRP